MDLCQLLFYFFRLRAVIPLYLLVPSYVALRGNWKTPKTQGFSQKPWPGWLKKNKTGVLRSIRWRNPHLQPGFVPSITVNVHGEAKLAQVYLLDVWCTANGFNCTCFGLFWIGRITKKCTFFPFPGESRLRSCPHNFKRAMNVWAMNLRHLSYPYTTCWEGHTPRPPPPQGVSVFPRFQVYDTLSHTVFICFWKRYCNLLF